MEERFESHTWLARLAAAQQAAFISVEFPAQQDLAVGFWQQLIAKGCSWISVISVV